MQDMADPIEHLDFAPDFGCEHNQHATHHHGNEAANFYVRGRCPHCKETAEYFLCRPGWQAMDSSPLLCEHCGKNSSRNECMKIVDIIKGY